MPLRRRQLLGSVVAGGTVVGAGCAVPPESERDGPRSTDSDSEPLRAEHVHGIVPADRDSFARLQDFETWLGGSPDVATVFVGFVDDPEAVTDFIENRLTPLWERGYVPIVTWEPYMRAPLADGRNLAEQIRDGEYGESIGEFAWRLSEWVREAEGRRLYVRFAHEMNGDWYPWGWPAVDPATYGDMWRRVHETFSSLPFQAETLQWMWAPNAGDYGDRAAEEYYPGDEYVDWIGIDGYNFGDAGDGMVWRDPETVFQPMVDRMRDLGEKPLAVPEYGSGSVYDGEHRPDRKAEWIREAVSLIRREGIAMNCWFNDDKETDWAVFGGARGTETRTVGGTEYAVYEDYRERTAPSVEGDDGYLTDEQFTGG